jgi:hypothetical protein
MIKIKNTTRVRVVSSCLFCRGYTILNTTFRQLAQHREGMHAQKVWPEKSAGWRETMISGAHEYCFDIAFADDDDEEEIIA